MLLNRNSILVIAVIAGLLFGQWAPLFKPYTIYFLATAMVFSTTGIELKAFLPIKKTLKPMLLGAILNYFLFGTIVLVLAHFFIDEKEIFYGFVVIAAAPPGIAVIPFSYILKGDVHFAIIGTLGAFLASIPFAPFIVQAFTHSAGVSSWGLFALMIKLVAVPIIFSRVLLIKPIKPITEKVRGKVVDLSFALIIFTAVGLNRQVFLSDYGTLLQVSLVLVLSTFGLGILFERFYNMSRAPKEKQVPANLLATIKSSGFSVVTAFTLWGERAALPSAVLAVVVLSYLIFQSVRVKSV